MNRFVQVRYRRWTWLAGIIAGLLIVGIVAHPPLRRAINTNQGVATVALTAMLVVLYFGQFHLQSRQLQFQNTPHVDIQEYNTNGKKIEIWLSNHGNGVATNIAIETCTDFESTENFAPGCRSKRLRRVDEEGDFNNRVGNTLKAGEHHVRFVGKPVTDITPDSEGGSGLRAATCHLGQDDVEEASFDFFVINEDILGRQYRERIFGWPFLVELEPRGHNIEEIKNVGRVKFQEEKG